MKDFFIKKFKKYFDGFLRSFIVFVKEKLPKDKTYFVNVLVQIIVKKYWNILQVSPYF